MPPVSRVLPPGPALRVSVIVVAVVVAVSVAAGVVAGMGVGVAAALGSFAVIPVALRAPDVRVPLAFGGVVAVLAGVATTATGDPVRLGLVVATAALAGAPVVRRLGPVLGPAPVVVALAGTEAAALGAGSAAVGVAIGAAATTAIIRLVIPGPRAPLPVARGITLAYVGALAIGTGTAIGVATALGVAHALWLVVVLCAVLVPAAAETRAKAVGRVGGALGGALLGTALAVLLPTWAAGAIAAVALVVGLAWALAQARVIGEVWIALAVVLVAASTEPDAVWGTAVDRAVLTLIGAAVALALALVVERAERRSTAVA